MFVRQSPTVRMEAAILNIIICAMLCVSCFAQNNIHLSYSIPEQQIVDTRIAYIGSDSNISHADIRYSLLAGESNEYFRIDNTDAALYIKQVIDRESLSACVFSTTCVLSLSIVAQSQVQNFFKKIIVDITVIDINDHRPSFAQEGMSVEILETANEGSIALIGAEDADIGNNSLQRYYIRHSSDEELPFDTHFEKFLDGKSSVMLVITGTLDRETRDFYQITVVAEDGGDPALTGTLLVNITVLDYNDNSPTFSQPSYNVTIKEDIARSSIILQLSATDPDLGMNGEIVYQLSTNQLDIIHELFAMNESSGELSMKGEFSSLSSAQYRVLVVASDRGQPQPLISLAVVLVNVLDTSNNPPEIQITLFSDSEMAQIPESAAVGTAVGHIALVDTDTGANGEIRCDIASDNEILTLEPFGENEYKIVVAKELDRETTDYIFVIVNCNDLGTPPLSTFAEFSVQVLDENDNSPRFLQEIYFVDVYENNQEDRELVQVSAIDYDYDKNGQVMYSVWSSSKYQFSVDPFSGFITTRSRFDREDIPRITVHAYATDGGTPARTSTATVVINVLDRNDNDPRFSQPLYDFSVYENAAIGTSVGRVRASDLDIEENGRVGILSDPNAPFSIDSTGLLTTAKVLDRETMATFNFLLTAYDHGLPARNSSATVVVRVLDENDNEPVFQFPSDVNYTIVLPATLPVETMVAKIEATDIDEGVNAQLFYSIQNVNSSDLFKINGLTGEIKLTRDLASQDQEIFYIHVKVMDNGNPSRSSETSLGIFLARQETTSRLPPSGGENLMIAITLGTVTFVLIFTIILVICIVKRRGCKVKEDGNGGNNRFYDKPSKEKKVQFADLTTMPSDPDPISKTTALSSMATFKSETGDESEFQLTMATDSTDTSESHQKISPRDGTTLNRSIDNKSPSVAFDLHHNSPSGSSDNRRHSPSGNLEGRRYSTPKLEQLAVMQSHNALLHSQIKKPCSFSPFGMDDNHSESSTETTTSDSGRGGSESDIHSASLSQSRDSDNISAIKKQFHQGLNKPWKVPTSAQYLHNHLHSKLPQVHPTRQTRPEQNQDSFTRGLCTQSHSNFDRSKFVRFQEPNFPPPPFDLDRSYMTYDEEEDDCSTTTSGSYTIDHEDMSLDIQVPGLRGCLV